MVKELAAAQTDCPRARLALRTEKNAYNVMATARMYYEVLYGQD